MGRIIAVINQKGGVGKTTTVLHLGAALSMKGYRVLLVDMDPQCNLSYTSGGEYDTGKTALEMVLRKEAATDCVQHLEKFDLIGGSSEMAQVSELLRDSGKEYRLRETLAPVKNMYDYVIIDSPPALSLITVNVLTACNSFLITSQADVFSMQGIGQLYSTYESVRSYCNPDLVIDGILLTRYMARSKFTRKISQDIREMGDEIGASVFETTIRESVRMKEAAEAQMDVFDYAPKSRLAEDYLNFAEEYLVKTGK